MSEHKAGGALAALVLASAALVVTAGPAGATGTADSAAMATGAAVADPAAGLAVASWGPNRLDVFARGSDNTLQHRVFNGRWSAWESLGGAVSSAPAATSWGPGRIDVFARSTTNTMLHRTFSNGAWGAWEDLAGVFTSAPAAVSWGTNRIDVFSIGTNTAMYHNSWNGTKWQPSWDNLSGVFNSAPTVASWGSGRLDVFSRGSANNLYHRSYSGGWSASWENLGGTLTSAPAAVSWAGSRIDIFASAGGGGNLVQKVYDGKWNGWVNLGGTMTGPPVVGSWAANRLDIFYPGTGNTLIRKVYDGRWHDPAELPAPAASIATQRFAGVNVVQSSPLAGATVGGLEYTYVNNVGQIVWGHQADPGNFGGVQWTVTSGQEKFSGRPGTAEQPDRRLLVAAHNTSSDVWTMVQAAQGAPAWGPFGLAGGAITGHPVLAKLPDGRLVIFATDAGGTPWALPQDAVNGAFGIWTNLHPGRVIAAVTAATLADDPHPVPGDLDPASPPTIVQTRDGLQLFGLNTAGNPRTATYSPAGTLSAWIDLGGSGFNGNPAVVVYPGYLMRVFVRAADGTIVTKAQNDAGVWAADWSPVGTLVSAGSPSAVLSPLTGRTELVARDADGTIFSTGETTQASGTWRDWVNVQLGADVAGTDPTAFTFNSGSGQIWAFTFLTTDQQGRVYTVGGGASLTAHATPNFTARPLPTPAR